MKISVIIPAYNRAGVLPRAIKSVVNQKCGEWELVVVDDGSGDDTKKVVNKFASADARIKLISFSENKGVNAARNAGAAAANGDWISFLDSDDEYLPDAFLTFEEFLRCVSSDVSVVSFINKVRAVDGSDQIGSIASSFEGGVCYPSYEDILLKRGGKGDAHSCIRKKVFEEGYEFPYWINGFESLFYCKLAKDNKKFLYVNRTAVLVHTDSAGRLSHEPYKKWPKQFAKAYKEFIKEHRAVLEKQPERLFRYCLVVAGCHKILGEYFSALFWLVKSFLVSPKLFVDSFLRKFS